MPPYLISKLPEAQELLNQGKTRTEIARETGVSKRTLTRWTSAGWLIRPSLSPVELARTDALEHAPEQDWTARDLLELGMEPAEAERNLLLLENTATVSSPRYREWLSKYIPLAAKMPDEWAAAVAFLPILGRDLCNPALGALAELMHESVPWKDDLLRGRYGGLAKPLLLEARSEFHDWLFFVANTEMVPELPRVEAAVILEVLRRCPHVDRPVQRRGPVHEEDKMIGLHLVRDMPMGLLTLIWSRLLDRDLPWLEAYGDHARKFQGADLCEVHVETLDFRRRSWLKWPRWEALWSR